MNKYVMYEFCYKFLLLEEKELLNFIRNDGQYVIVESTEENINKIKNNYKDYLSMVISKIDAD